MYLPEEVRLARPTVGGNGGLPCSISISAVEAIDREERLALKEWEAMFFSLPYHQQQSNYNAVRLQDRLEQGIASSIRTARS